MADTEATPTGYSPQGMTQQQIQAYYLERLKEQQQESRQQHKQVPYLSPLQVIGDILQSGVDRMTLNRLQQKGQQVRRAGAEAAIPEEQSTDKPTSESSSDLNTAHDNLGLPPTGKPPADQSNFARLSDAPNMPSANEPPRPPADIPNVKTFQRQSTPPQTITPNTIDPNTGHSVGLSNAALDLTSKGETGQPLGPKSLYNISPDAGGSFSYGTLGLNSRTGSMSEFVKTNPHLGLTAQPGTPEFNQQYRNVDPIALRNATVDWHDKHVMTGLTESLIKAGVPEAIANDPKVQLWAADRKVQMGTTGFNAVVKGAQNATSPQDFIQKATTIDNANIRSNFPTYLKGHPNDVPGLVNRNTLRAQSSLGYQQPQSQPTAPQASTPAAAPVAPPQASTQPPTLGPAGMPGGQSVAPNQPPMTTGVPTVGNGSASFNDRFNAGGFQNVGGATAPASSAIANILQNKNAARSAAPIPVTTEAASTTPQAPMTNAAPIVPAQGGMQPVGMNNPPPTQGAGGASAEAPFKSVQTSKVVGQPVSPQAPSALGFSQTPTSQPTTTSTSAPSQPNRGVNQPQSGIFIDPKDLPYKPRMTRQEAVSKLEAAMANGDTKTAEEIKKQWNDQHQPIQVNTDFGVVRVNPNNLRDQRLYPKLEKGTEKGLMGERPFYGAITSQGVTKLPITEGAQGQIPTSRDEAKEVPGYTNSDPFPTSGPNLDQRQYEWKGRADARAAGLKTRTEKDEESFNTLYHSIAGATLGAVSGGHLIDSAKEQLNDPKFYSGAGEGFNLAWKRLLAATGIDPGAALPQEAFRKTMSANIQAQVQDLRTAQEQMSGTAAGRLFQQQISLMEKAAQNPENTIQANKYLTELAAWGRDRTKTIGKMTNDYKVANGGLDAKFYQKLVDGIEQYDKDHPAPKLSDFKENTAAEPATKVIGGKTYYQRGGKWYDE